MFMVKRNFDEGLEASIKKLHGGKKNEALANKYLSLYSFLSESHIPLNTGKSLP